MKSTIPPYTNWVRNRNKKKLKLKKWHNLDKALGVSPGFICSLCQCHTCIKGCYGPIRQPCTFRAFTRDTTDHRWRELCRDYYVSYCKDYEGGDTDA